MDLFANYGLIGWVIVGGIAGMIAKFLMPGKDGGGILLTILLGIGGAVVAGFLGALLGFYGPG
ncbi:MAG: GlsB/YeaQ/YmgE family stress response membrane protein, partial [Pseudomonadota bacterium]